MLKKILTILLTVTLLCSMSITCYADNTNNILDSIVGVKGILITSQNCHLAVSGGTATCSSNITVQSGTDSVRIVMYLQKNVSGVWSSIASWSSNYSGNYGSMTRTYGVSSGYSYRVRSYFYAYDGGSSESSSGTSNIVAY